jgi:hypothetical protein
MQLFVAAYFAYGPLKCMAVLQQVSRRCNLTAVTPRAVHSRCQPAMSDDIVNTLLLNDIASKKFFNHDIA